jgi:hypothetical protein
VTISQILGCPSKTNKRRKRDFYPTPAHAIGALSGVENHLWPRVIWDPCVGKGDIIGVVASHGFKVVGSDLAFGVDFLKKKSKDADAIITNPPYKHATEFIRHANKLGVAYHAWLLKADFLCAKRGLKLVEDIGYPARIWGLTKRPDFLGQGAPVMNCAWYVWHGTGCRHSSFRLLPMGSRKCRDQ